MKRYVASCSFGKDSMATVILALEHNEPLDEVTYCEVMFDEHISGEVPEHLECDERNGVRSRGNGRGI